MTFKVIPNTENKYYISDTGVVKKGDKILSQQLNRKENGYFTCKIKIDGIYKRQYVHRLVAMTFIGDVERMTVNHINGDKYDNTDMNLEIVTHLENMNHAKTLSSYKEGIKKSSTSKKILSEEKEKELIEDARRLSISELSRKYKIGRTTVSDYLKRNNIQKSDIARKVNQYK